MDDDYCPRCGAALMIGSWPFCRGRPEEHGRPAGKKNALFPFEGRHITPDGRPITIDSLQHLRKIEREYGVVLPAFSKDNIRDIDPIRDPPRYLGDERGRRRR